MPTRLIGEFLCYFVSYDCTEPPHIHLAKGKNRNAPGAKFWLEPVELERNKGLNAGDLRDAFKIVNQNRMLFLEMWDEHCND